MLAVPGELYLHHMDQAVMNPWLPQDTPPLCCGRACAESGPSGTGRRGGLVAAMIR